MPRQKFENFIEKTYEVSSLQKRAEIAKEYKNVEQKINDFYEKKISAKEMSNILGNVVLGTNGEHASTQIYAYENLLKSLSEIQQRDKEDVENITGEAIYDIAVEKNPMKRAYLLGILYHYSSQERLDQIEKQLSSSKEKPDQKTEDEKNIISSIRSSSSRLKNNDNFFPEENKVADYILNDFSGNKNECETARLIADYYDKEPHATRMPEPGKKSIINNEDIWNNAEGNGIPRYVYVLPEEYHPSQEKLDEADNFGIHLTPQVAVFEGQNKIFVDYDMNPELARLYNRRIRHYKDTNNLAKVEQLENAFRERVWRDISNKDPEAANIFGDRENIVVLRRTIRDWPDDVDMVNLLNEDFAHEDHVAA
tara:strand:+ start:2628 stop:3728 length:1101 start_codon:yes stop_codon:yes gene_type:complete